jgi:signal transduction histidine kinase
MALSQLGGWMTDVRALQALAEYLQEETEKRSAALARALHDDLGGSLTAAMMDVAWLTRHPTGGGGEGAVRLNRIEGSLTKAIESMRYLVDELQPALLESIGLFVALSAHFGRECRRYSVAYSDTLVGASPPVEAPLAMAIFRIAQGFLQWILEDAAANELRARYEGDPERLTLHFVARGIRAGAMPSQGNVAPRLASIALRLRKLNGTLTSEVSNDSVTIQVQIPARASSPQIAA